MTVPSKYISRQRGAALILLMLIVIVASTTVLLANVNRDDMRTRRISDTQAMLAKAKEALLEYAVLNPDLNPGRPFSLPCPDIDGSGGLPEGEAHTGNCGAQGVSVIGRLPWRTLGIAAPEDGASECLWYVISGSFKDAGATTATMINSDTNGQLQLVSLDSGTVTQGVLPQDRPAAMLIAAMQPVAGQTRPAAVAGLQCSPGFTPSDFLDGDAGFSNATISGVADGVDAFASYAGIETGHNDRILTISRAEIAARIAGRPDFDSDMRDLGLAIALCVANYGLTNPGGVNDRRLPWPAGVALADYRDDGDYDDLDNGMFSGRLPDIVDDSNAATGNGTGRVLTDCDPAQVPQWSPVMLSLWRDWKDHFFYAVAQSNLPTATVPSTCSNCLTVNGAGQYAAVVLFSGQRLDALGQLRNAPPTDADTKRDVPNYLESSNAASVPGPGTLIDYTSQSVSPTFNDRLFCIDENLAVSEC